MEQKDISKSDSKDEVVLEFKGSLMPYAVKDSDYVEPCRDCDEKSTHILWASKKAFPMYLCDKHLPDYILMFNESGINPMVYSSRNTNP